MGNPIACVRACAHFALVTMTVFLCFGFASAQSSTLNVTGTVTAGDGTPVAGAAVVLESPGTSRSARSDAHGAFTIKNVPSGTYALHASAPGYELLRQRTVTVGPSNSTLAVLLSRATTNSLTVIGHVSASAGETVSTASAPSVTMSAQQAAASGAVSVGPMLWGQLSVTPVLPLGGGSNATEAFSVRGPDPRETVVDIDGHQVNNGNTGDFDLSLVDPAALQSVQVIYGIAPSSLIGPDTIGGGINIVTLEPSTTPHSLLRLFGGSYGTVGETLQTTGTDDRLGYAISLHNVDSAGSVNQTILAPAPGVAPPADNETLQGVGSDSRGNSILTKFRYQLGGSDGYGYIQLDLRNQTVSKDESALLTNYTPAGFSGGGGDAAPFDQAPTGGYQSFAGTVLGAHQSNYGLDAQMPLGNEQVNSAPATLLQFSHLTTLAAQSVSGPGAQTQQYLYNQRDLLGDDWLEIDHRFATGMLSFKYDLGNESLGTNYVQGQVIAGAPPVGADKAPPVQDLTLGQTYRDAVLRYNGDPTSHIHYSIAAYQSDYTTFGSSFDPRAGFVWTPTGNTAVRASVGTTFQAPQLSELVVPPPAERVPVGGVVYAGNPNLKADQATDYDLGMEQIFGKARHPLHFSFDLYQSNLRSPAAQLNVVPNPNCQTRRNPTPCPISMPVNAGNGTYRGIAASVDQQLGSDIHLRAGWSVDSSFLTVIPVSIQDGTIAAGEQSLGQPLHKAYLALEQSPPFGLAYGAELDYEGWYNELNRSPYATLGAHVAYRHDGFEYGLYGTNLTNVYANPFTVIGGGFVYGGTPGQPVIPTDAYTLQGASVTFVVTRSI
jgi:outer membrane receptor protein involved in Fe transport